MQDPHLIGVKRKYCEVDEPPCYLDQRQSILNISMCKLKTSSVRRVEPSLRRSVLIFNTLRYIEHELKEEGVCSTPPTSLLPSLQHTGDLTLDPPPGADCTGQNDSTLSGVCVPRCASNGAVTSSQQPMDISTSSSLTDAVRNMDISASTNCLAQEFTNCAAVALTESTRVQPSSVSSTVSPGKTLSVVNNNHIPYTQDAHVHTSGSSSQHTRQKEDMDMSTSCTNSTTTDVFAMINFTSLYEDNLSINNTPTNQNSSLPVMSTTTTITPQPLLKCEDILDIDLPLYDFDTFSPLPPSVKLTPLSAEDLIHALPSSGSFTETFSTSCKNEILIDDLDHIMQILVGM